jgi:hypothetical protein
VDQILVLALSSVVNPALVAATTVMLLLPNAGRLMLGYLLGALMTSIALGLTILFAFEGSSTAHTAETLFSPALSVALGGIALVAALVLAKGADKRVRDRRRARAGHGRGSPRWRRELSKGSPRTTFVIGCLLTLPGASYLAALHRLDSLNYSIAGSVLVVLGFNAVMLLPLEVPLLSVTVAPEWTVEAIDRARGWVARHGRQAAVSGLTLVGAALVIKGAIELLV